MTRFNYTYTQKNGKVSIGQVNLDRVLNAKIIKFDEQDKEDATKTIEQEVVLLELDHNHQQPVEIPIEQPATKEQRLQGIRNFSHSKWELGWVPFTVHITKEDDVKKIKEILKL